MQLEKYKEALKISEEIGDKRSIACVFNNIGTTYFNNEENDTALEYFFKSFALYNEIENESELIVVREWIYGIIQKLGKENFKNLAQRVYMNLQPEIQKNIHLDGFFNDPIKRKSPKVGRNDRCPCGSGKKYKTCHGKN